MKYLKVGDRVRVYSAGWSPKIGVVDHKYGHYWKVTVDLGDGESAMWQCYPQQCRRLRKKDKRVVRAGFSVASGLILINRESLARAWDKADFYPQRAMESIVFHKLFDALEQLAKELEDKP
jgi:hypothetical protein